MAASGGWLRFLALTVAHGDVDERCAEVAIWVEAATRRAERAGVVIRRASDAQATDCSMPESVRAGIPSVAARLASGIWGGVLVMGDGRRHKVMHAQRG